MTLAKKNSERRFLQASIQLRDSIPKILRQFPQDLYPELDNTTKLTSASNTTLPATIHERTRLIRGLVECLLGAAVIRLRGLFRVCLGAFRDGHHGGLGPDVDGLIPV
jgi:hypothetical protein